MISILTTTKQNAKLITIYIIFFSALLLAGCQSNRLTPEMMETHLKGVLFT